MTVKPSSSGKREHLTPLAKTLQQLQQHRYATLGAALLLLLSIGYGTFTGSSETTTADATDDELIDLGDFSDSALPTDLKPIPPALKTVAANRQPVDAEPSAWELQTPGVQSANLTIPLDLTSAPAAPANASPAWLIGTIESVDDPVAEAPQAVERISFDGPLLLPR